MRIFFIRNLRPYGRADRDRLLKKASDTPLDLIEWVGILAALVFVVVLTRYNVAGFGLADRIAGAVVNFLVAICFLVSWPGRSSCDEKDGVCAHSCIEYAMLRATCRVIRLTAPRATLPYMLGQ